MGRPERGSPRSCKVRESCCSVRGGGRSGGSDGQGSCGFGVRRGVGATPRGRRCLRWGRGRIRRVRAWLCPPQPKRPPIFIVTDQSAASREGAGRPLRCATRRVVQVVEDRPALQPPRLYHRQHPFHETAPRLALAAEGVLPPQHPARSTRSAWLFVGSTPSLTTNRHAAGNNASTFAQKVAALLSAHRRPALRARSKAPRRAVQPPLQLLSVAAAPAEQVPLHEHPLGDTLQPPPQRRRRPAPIDQLLEVPLQMHQHTWRQKGDSRS